MLDAKNFYNKGRKSECNVVNVEYFVILCGQVIY